MLLKLKKECPRGKTKTKYFQEKIQTQEYLDENWNDKCKPNHSAETHKLPKKYLIYQEINNIIFYIYITQN